jgi:hypothetical protein
VIAGRYRPDREVGRGGMGAVWLARDEVLGRAVAMKRIGRVPGGEVPDLDRAEREARLAARLNHPHVVAVFDLVAEGEDQWLVMEYVEGETLAGRVRRSGALLPDEAARLLVQAADALAAAHTAGIVHRDVKPSNILVGPDGQVKLSDFGIARAEADASLTQTGLVTGSPAYLAPEVASGGQATDASDVWSLGATLFHALAGRPPYEVGENLMGALYRIVHEEPPRLTNAGWLAPLLEHTMTQEPADRWSMVQVRDFLAHPPGGSLPETAPTAVVPARATPPAPVAERTPTEVFPAQPAAPPQHRRPWLTAPPVVGTVLGLVVALVVWLALSNANDAEPTADPSDSTSRSATDAPRPTKAGMESFIGDYLATAAEDPASGFRMLTPGFQAASGGIEGYRGFWDTVAAADLVSVDAQPRALTVDYLVSYTLENGQRSGPEEVSLTLTFDDGTYLIDGES